MKKSGKILIVVLCLIILGLVTFIAVDKVINNKNNNINENTTNIVENNASNNDANRMDASSNNKIVSGQSEIDNSANTQNKGNKTIKSIEDIRIVSDYNYVSSTSGYMKVTAFGTDSNVIWTYKTETADSFDYVYKLDWFHTDKAYVLLGDHIVVLDALTGDIINNCRFSGSNENDYLDILATTTNTEKGYYYVLVRDYGYNSEGNIKDKDVIYKIDNKGAIVGKGNIKGDYGIETIYDSFAQGVSVTEIHVDSSEKVLTCMLSFDEGGSEERSFDIEFK